MKLKATYSVPELAEMAGITRHEMLRVLRSNGVPLARNGRKIVVFLSAFKRAMPDLWESILDVVSLRAGASRASR